MKAALIGLGMVSGTYADALSKSETVGLGPVFARSREARERFTAEHGGMAAGSVEQIASDPSVDFAIVATPPNAREEIVRTLAEAQMPILMEKPVERTVEAAERIVALCEDAGVPLGIVLQHRARPVVADLRRVMPSLGTLRMVEVSVPWWRPQSYYDEPGRGTYARDGGGVLISQAIHTLDLTLSLTGPVAEVTALTATCGHRMEAEDFVSAGVQFENGAVGHLMATTASYPGRGETITLHFAEGSARLEAGQLCVDRHDGTSETFGAAATSGAGADPMAFTSDWHRAVIEDFANAVRNRRPPLVPGREALDVHRLIAALERSGRNGRRVSV